MASDDMTDDEYLDGVRKAREQSVRSSSSANRAERELWVARKSLLNLGVDFEEVELVHVADHAVNVNGEGE